MQSLHLTVERMMYMNSMQSEHCLKFPYHCFCKRNPRFISENLLYGLLDNEEIPSNLKNQGEILQAFRKFRLYTDLESIHLYELSNAYAYETALRTERVKDMFQDALRGSTFVVLQSDEVWIDIEEALKFENHRYDDNIAWSKKVWWSTSPQKTLPEIKVPPEETDYLPISLNMYLPENELKKLLLAYIENLEVMRAKKALKKDDTEIYRKVVTSNIKMIHTKNTMINEFHKLIGKIKKPDAKTLKLAEYFFTYDMMEFGFSPEDIAQAIKNHRLKLLITLNGEGLKEELEEMLAFVDPAKTIIKWHQEIQTFIKDEGYKRFISPNTPGLLSADGYITKNTSIKYYDPK